MKKACWLQAFAFLFAVLYPLRSQADAVPLVNGDFSQGTQGWNFWTNDTGAGSITVENGQAKIIVTSPGQNTWSVGISSPGIAMIRGRRYRVDFEAQAIPPINLASEIRYHRAPWTSYSGAKTFAAAAFQAFSYTFTMRQDDDSQAAFQLMFGDQATGVVVFDNVVVTDLGPDESEPIFPADLQDRVVSKGLEDCTVVTFSQVLPQQSEGGLDLVPITAGKLNGSVSLMDAYQELNRRNQAAAGCVPQVFFLDWPGKEINDYYSLSVEQKKDFWRLYAAEAYAAGCYYAFHLSNVMPGEPTAEESGVLDFFVEYAGFYRRNSDLYHGNACSSRSVQVTGTNVAFNLMEQPASSRCVLHLVNHNYQDRILAQQGIRAVIGLDAEPARVYAVSPDFEGQQNLRFRFEKGALSVEVGGLTYYSAVVVVGAKGSVPPPASSEPPRTSRPSPRSTR